MPQGATTQERLGDLANLQCGEHAGDHLALLEGILQRQRVDQGRQHPHVIRGHTVGAPVAEEAAAEDVSTADDQRDLDAEPVDVDDLVRQAVEHGTADAVLRVALQRLPGQFEEDPAVAKR